MTRRVPLHRLRRLLIVPAVVAALASCAMQEGTQGWYNPTDGTSTDAGPIAIRNILVVASADGEATVVASLVNDGAADALTEVTVGGVQGQSGAGPVDLPTGDAVSLGPEGDTRIDVSGIETAPGHTVEVSFRFENAPQASATAIVTEDDGLYAGAFSDS